MLVFLYYLVGVLSTLQVNTHTSSLSRAAVWTHSAIRNITPLPLQPLPLQPLPLQPLPLQPLPLQPLPSTQGNLDNSNTYTSSIVC